MKITRNEIKRYENEARRYLKMYNIDEELVFDHFGLQTLNADEYNGLKNYFIEIGMFDGEIVYHNRRLGKFILGKEQRNKLELIEPHPGEVFLQIDCYVEHVAFIVPDLSKYFDMFQDRILSTFSIGESRGFKIQGSSILQIELRSNEF